MVHNDDGKVVFLDPDEHVSAAAFGDCPPPNYRQTEQRCFSNETKDLDPVSYDDHRGSMMDVPRSPRPRTEGKPPPCVARSLAPKVGMGIVSELHALRTDDAASDRLQPLCNPFKSDISMIRIRPQGGCTQGCSRIRFTRPQHGKPPRQCRGCCSASRPATAKRMGGPACGGRCYRRRASHHRPSSLKGASHRAARGGPTAARVPWTLRL